MNQLSRRLFVLSGLAALSSCSSYVPEGTTSPVQLTTELVTAKINDVRRAHGREPLRHDSRLAAAARSQAQLMAQKDTLSHDLGVTLRERVRAAGYAGAVGENVGGGQKTLEAVITGWLDSASHRSTLLSPNFTEFGLAAARVAPGRNSRYGIYWAIILGGDTRLWLQA